MDRAALPGETHFAVCVGSEGCPDCGGSRDHCWCADLVRSDSADLRRGDGPLEPA